LNWLESVDAWRRAERFTDLLHTWLAAQPHSNALLDRLRRCRDISRRVPAPDPDSNRREMVRNYRLQRITQALDE
jgi:hypothetical protein